MPHFTIQISPQGPILNAYVGVSNARRSALTAAQQPVPNPIHIRALVDTGASCTCIDPSVLNGLGLSPTGNVSVNTPSTGSNPHAADQYDVALIIPPDAPGQAALIFPAIPVVAAELLVAQGFHALIGRDILRLCILEYNGTMGTFTLAY